MKKNSLFALVLAGFFTSSSCEPLINEEDQAEKAAAEMCECIKKKSLSDCKDKLNKDYGHYANNDDFIKTFNNAQECGVTIFKEKK